MHSFRPSDFKAPFSPSAFLIEADSLSLKGALEVDVLCVGAGPASLALAIRLLNHEEEARRAASPSHASPQNGAAQRIPPPPPLAGQAASPRKLKIAVIEKARAIGGHSLSGAVVNIRILKELFPNSLPKNFPLRERVRKERFYILSERRAFPLPFPPSLKSQGCRTASLSEMVRWMAGEAEKKGALIFPNTAANKLIIKEGKVIGALTAVRGENRDGSKESRFEPPLPILARAVALGEGSRGHLTQALLAIRGGASAQTYGLGVKELWKVKTKPLSTVYTMGWPLDSRTFGGGWLYPMGEGLVSLGIVTALDSPRVDLSPHDSLRQLKRHPLFQKILKGGERLEWGAKTVPEGGFHSLPKRLDFPGALIVGDSAGFVNMASLKGIHYAMASGVYAADTLYDMFLKNDFSDFSAYTRKIQKSFIAKELWRSRNLRAGFSKGLFRGLLNGALITASRGLLPYRKSALEEDAQKLKSFLDTGGEEESLRSKREALYLSGNRTRDNIPSHLKAPADLPPSVIKFYSRLCPAGVYEERDGKLVIHPSNCIDCKATDILGPGWSPREGGSGPEYRRM